MSAVESGCARSLGGSCWLTSSNGGWATPEATLKPHPHWPAPGHLFLEPKGQRMGHQVPRHHLTSGYHQVYGAEASKPLLSEHGRAIPFLSDTFLLKDAISGWKMELTKAAPEISTRGQRAGKDPMVALQVSKQDIRSLNFYAISGLSSQQSTDSWAHKGLPKALI